MPVDRESEEYNMNHLRRGYATIFNHDEFSHDMPTRKGSHIDVQQLTNILEMLHFEVKVYNNLDCEKIREVLNELASMDHSDCDCLLVAVLTHGLKSNYLYAKDYIYSVDTLWLPFTADRCLSLAGKPKMFLIQACRGEALDAGVRLVSTSQTDSGNISYKIPSMADFFIAYSTAEGYYSWRHPEKGTWFIQSFCQVLNDHYRTLDFQKIMTRVSHRVAIEFESYNDCFLEQHEQKQVPNMHSTLIRDVYFRPKV
ncbi:hypothetical protein AAG570_006349 [Ranatra chinensis]|uniref:Caspase-1 n=1 Tax=Ranatra chinensis TaxID=642074 RepID=A0ABD0YTR0_9HEMI